MRRFVHRAVTLTVIGLAAGLLSATNAAPVAAAPGAPQAQASDTISPMAAACTGGRWIHYPYPASFPKIFLPARDRLTHCELRVGHRNFGVVALQNTLIKCYNQNIALDGIFGSQTRRALINAQTWERALGRNVSPDGVYGSFTRNALEWPRYRSTGNLNAPRICRHL